MIMTIDTVSFAGLVVILTAAVSCILRPLFNRFSGKRNIA